MTVYSLMICTGLIAAIAQPQCENDSPTGECGASDSALGSAMLQVSRSKALAPTELDEYLQVSRLQDRMTEDEQDLDSIDTEKSAKEFPLTSDGFRACSDGCCYKKMDFFVRRVVEDLGYEVCDEGCHSGFLPFFTCKPSETLQSLQAAIIAKSQDGCPCYSQEGMCKPLGDACPQGFESPSSHRRRDCGKDSNAIRPPDIEDAEVEEDEAEPVTLPPVITLKPDAADVTVAPMTLKPDAADVTVTPPDLSRRRRTVAPTAAPTDAPTNAPTDILPPDIEDAEVEEDEAEPVTLAPVITLKPDAADVTVAPMTLKPDAADVTVAPPDLSRRRRTVAPTAAPTDAPTNAPTDAPTVAPTTAPPSLAGPPKDIVLAIDASKSVTSDGWAVQSQFAAELVNGLMGNGNPNQHAIVPYYFNAEANLIGQPGQKNAAGTWQFDASSVASAITALNYPSIREGSTDHPQVFLTAEANFNAGRSGSPKVLVLITDGDTHKGNDCKKLSQSTVEAKIGKCTNGGDHVCAFGRVKGSGVECDPEKCMCGVYTSSLYKDKGFQLVIVGIANQHHIGEADAGMFKKVMAAMASPGSSFYAQDFEDLLPLTPSVVSFLSQ
jgi:hypothetical protein